MVRRRRPARARAPVADGALSARRLRPPVGGARSAERCRIDKRFLTLDLRAAAEAEWQAVAAGGSRRADALRRWRQRSDARRWPAGSGRSNFRSCASTRRPGPRSIRSPSAGCWRGGSPKIISPSWCGMPWPRALVADEAQRLGGRYPAERADGRCKDQGSRGPARSRRRRISAPGHRRAGGSGTREAGPRDPAQGHSGRHRWRRARTSRGRAASNGSTPARAGATRTTSCSRGAGPPVAGRCSPTIRICRSSFRRCGTRCIWSPPASTSSASRFPAPRLWSSVTTPGSRGA